MRKTATFARTYPHLLIPAAALFAIEVATSFTPAYECFIDELHSVACAKRLAFGYVDHHALAAGYWRFCRERASCGPAAGLEALKALRVAHPPPQFLWANSGHPS